MKKSDVINSITQILQKWENCKLDYKASREILTKLESLGMTPPSYFGSKASHGLVLKQGWEPEGKPQIEKKIIPGAS